MRGMSWRQRESRSRIPIQHFLNRFPKLTFGIEHELAGGDNAFAFVQSAQHFVRIVVRARTEPYLAWLKMSAIDGDKYSVLLSASKHGRVGHEQCSGFEFSSQLNGSEHSRLQEEPWIVKLHPHPSRARLFIDRRINVSNSAAKLPVG